jgi:hypothetical protein
MNKRLLSKIFPIVALASIVAFLYVNTASWLGGNVHVPKTLTEQARVEAEKAAAEKPAAAAGLVVKVIQVARHFLPVSNQ